MPLLKKGEVVSDPWLKIVNGDAVPAEGPVIVPFERWKKERETLLGRNTPIGVNFPNNQPVAELIPDLERLDVIVLEFPKFIDGRAFSQARLLRERHGYRNELRAAGNVLRDQLLFMHRCGFDAYEIAHENAVDEWRAALKEFSAFFQPAGDGSKTVAQLRREGRS